LLNDDSEQKEQGHGIEKDIGPKTELTHWRNRM
jgi:hypothetical protein